MVCSSATLSFPVCRLRPSGRGEASRSGGAAEPKTLAATWREVPSRLLAHGLVRRGFGRVWSPPPGTPSGTEAPDVDVNRDALAETRTTTV